MSKKTLKPRYSSRKDTRHNYSTREILYISRDGKFFTHLDKSHIYKPAIPQLVKALFKDELERAKKRVKKTPHGYIYIPSQTYLKFIMKLKSKLL